MHLHSGGIIANYRCNAACGHCMYGSSPTAEAGYITAETAKRICETLLRHGCQSVHIGGGEPFLHPDKLAMLVRVITQSGLTLDYIETNAGWINHDTARNKQILLQVLDAGADCIMVSADPFHIGFIPFYKPLALLALLRDMNASYFVWQQRYMSALSSLDPERTYTPDELKTALGYDIERECAAEYGMGFNGRALNLLRRFGKKKPLQALLTSEPCRALSDTGHFHADYLGRFIPPRCTGLGIDMETLGQPVTAETHPVIARLQTEGLQGLYALASSHGFIAGDGYYSHCDLCFAMRKHLALQTDSVFPDLTPRGFYLQDY